MTVYYVQEDEGTLRNPTPLDRNLEWDRKNNGFKGECPPYRLP